ncbi:hypothetical protein [Parasitella parasitica]|uniref:Uncharacterized protein n=1 Tax=Parasitella parasitica TaxID=35722 RepID=A0A0B7NRF2_9FUNG|nr:hypothetical protein [Parasitella parasitica]
MQFSAYCANQNTQLPFTPLIEKSESCIFIGCISPLDSALELQQTLSYTSTIFDRLNHKDKQQDSTETNATLTTRSQENPEYLKSLIVKLSNEVNLLRSHSASSTQSSKHGSMFSSVSHSTSATLPDIAEDRKEHVMADLHRQIEELENQMTVTKERNKHVEHELVAIQHTNMNLWELSDKQSVFIDVLESKLDQLQNGAINDAKNIKRDMQQLSTERLEIEENLDMIKNSALLQENKLSSALEELKVIRQQFEQQRDGTSDNSYSFSTQCTRVLENRDRDTQQPQASQGHNNEVEKWKHTALVQSAKAKALETRLNSLENELNVHRKAARDGDISGLVANLEEHVLRLQQERGELKQNYETQARQTKQLEAALAEAYQQLVQRDPEVMSAEKRTMKKPSPDRQSNTLTESVYRKRKTINTMSIAEKPQLISWVQEKLSASDTVDVLQKVSSLADENMELAQWVDDLETQLMSQRHHLSQQVKTLECDIMNLTVLNSQLERQIEPRKPRSRKETHPSYRSTTPNVPPPTEPPNQPLPPIPSSSPVTDQLTVYKQKVEAAENQVRTHETHIKRLESQIASAESKEQKMEQNYSVILRDLDSQERRRKKAEKANAILEKRLQDLLNKKSKFLCL